VTVGARRRALEEGGGDARDCRGTLQRDAAAARGGPRRREAIEHPPRFVSEMPSPVPVGVGQTTRLGPCAGRGVRPHAETHAPGMCVNTPQARSPTPPSGCAWWSRGGRGARIPSDHPCGARPPRTVTAAASWRRPPSGARARAVPLSPLHRRSTRPLDRPPRPVSAVLWAPDGTGQDCAEPTHPNSTGPRVATVKDVLARCAAS